MRSIAWTASSDARNATTRPCVDRPLDREDPMPVSPSRLAVTLAALATLLAAPLAPAQQPPLVKQGACPSGYHTSGSYCVPSSSSARPALPKIGSCPSGYHTSGDYCLGSSPNAKPAVVKRGACPSGYRTSGDYCLAN
jgi:hypothetical protein